MHICYTKGLSNTCDAIPMVRAGLGADTVILASHTRPDVPVRRVADEFLEEPREPMSAEAYGAWVLETAVARQVDLVVPQRRPTALWPLREAFAAAGIRLLLAGDPATLRLLDDKLAFHRDLALFDDAAAPGHAAVPFQDLASFDAAWAQMSGLLETRHGLCVKPVSGIFGSGFRRIEPGLSDIDIILSMTKEDRVRLSLSAFRRTIEGGVPQPMMLMPYLPGLERSVDFVARDGELLCAVSRYKVSKEQILELEGPSIEAARALARRYRLHGMLNLQTKECDGRQVILEINPRMAGGMAMACLAPTCRSWRCRSPWGSPWRACASRPACA